MIKVKKFKSIIVEVVKRSYEDDIFSLASQLAYNLLLAMFPFIIFLFTLVGYSSVNSRDIMEILREFIPKDTFLLVQKTVREIADTKNGGLLSVSIILAVWSAASGINAVIKGLNKAYNEKESRGIVKVQLISVVFTVALAFVIMLTVVLLVLGQVNGYLLIGWFGYSGYFGFVWYILRFIIIVFMMIFVFSGLYIYAPCKRHSLKEVLPGSIFASVGWIISSLAFSFYVNNFGNYASVYGSIGAVIVLMLWLLISSFIIILGGEINSSIMVSASG